MATGLHNTASALLALDDPPPFRVENADGRSPFLLICDHAGTAIPRRLQQLGLEAIDLQRHIGWDLGAVAMARHLAQALDAVLIWQPYSRLVIDCNRPPRSPDSIVYISDSTVIPGNRSVTALEASQREAEIFAPYHERIRTELDARLTRGQATLLIAVHSFTPVYHGHARPWHVAVLYHRDTRMAVMLRDLLRAENGLVVGDNEPYSVGDDTDYAIPQYGERRGLPHVELELRQDLIMDEAGQQAWAQRLAPLLAQVAASLAAG